MQAISFSSVNRIQPGLSNHRLGNLQKKSEQPSQTASPKFSGAVMLKDPEQVDRFMYILGNAAAGHESSPIQQPHFISFDQNQQPAEIGVKTNAGFAFMSVAQFMDYLFSGKPPKKALEILDTYIDSAEAFIRENIRKGSELGFFGLPNHPAYLLSGEHLNALKSVIANPQLNEAQKYEACEQIAHSQNINPFSP